MASSNSDESIEIDGSIMEGGGQILRNAVSFACLLNSSVCIHNIRGGRSTPGLRAQHMTGLQLIRDITSGKLFGDEIGSMAVTLHPSSIGCGTFTADTKTAGSVCLLMQLALPCLLFAPAVSKLILKGGTNAEMAPPIEYMTDEDHAHPRTPLAMPLMTCPQTPLRKGVIRPLVDTIDTTVTPLKPAINFKVMRPIVKKQGVQFDCDIISRGYFPKGGGEVHVTVNPIKHLRPLQLLERGPLARITGQAFVAGVLPFRVAQTMAREADRILKKKYPNVDVNIEPVQEPDNKSRGNGSGIMVIAESKTGCRLAGSALGRKGVPAEEVARNAVDELTNNLQHGGCVDDHLQDQLVIFMALAKGHSSLRCGPLTMHTQTAIYVAEKIMKAKIKVEEVSDKEGCIIECEGIGLQNQNL